ncbi:glycolate oxidase subunit GlcF [Methylothermus subterraneus]
MRVRLADGFKEDPKAAAAARLVRACVHCGFCNATCPTYRLLGDELDGPRGRIYQIKSVLEGQPPTRRIQTHLDRCLNCRACETTCPSGVRYGKLLDLGQQLLEQKLKRPGLSRCLRLGLRTLLPYPLRLRPWVRLGQILRVFLPVALRARLPEAAPAWPEPTHARRMLILDGCVQAVLAPQINAAAARALDRLGVSLIVAPKAGCCGALSYHLGAREEGLAFARRNIDAWWPYLAQGVEAIVTTASGCGLMLKEYGELLADDPRYAAKAAVVSARTQDLSEVLASCPDLDALRPGRPLKVAFHSPCTLQHGLRLGGVVERILERLGMILTQVPDAHLCCGSAGAYSLLQPKLARRLRQEKLAALESGAPDLIATANIGCLLYLKPAARRPVVHWVELLEPAGQSACRSAD